VRLSSYLVHDSTQEEGETMTRIRNITVSKAAVADKQIDPLGAAFLGLWAAVFSWILIGAFSSKSR
jgi:hypothetical protein